MLTQRLLAAIAAGGGRKRVAHDFCTGQTLLLPGVFEPVVRPARLIPKRFADFQAAYTSLDLSRSVLHEEVVEQNVPLRKALRQVEERSGSRNTGFRLFAFWVWVSSMSRLPEIHDDAAPGGGPGADVRTGFFCVAEY